ncbi:MAG: hypothetical protein KAY32_03510 [Candidatus Eisenbacteria sp.]|nr:hypothetical protein [Candidatus Eisenbacteria bacterium]
MPRPSHALPPNAAGARRRFRWLLWGAVLLLLLWVPLTTGLRFPAKMDEASYHLPNVARFLDHFPTLEELRATDLSMLPLFHGALAQAARLTGAGLPALRGWMMSIGLLALCGYALLARHACGAPPTRSALALAAFPYFGVCYFTLMTDYPAFLALVAALLGQVDYLIGRRARGLWLAAFGGLLACLIRQNLIVFSGVFALLVAISHLGRGGLPRPIPRIPPPWVIAALVLPFVGLGFQLLLWDGLLPPAYMARQGYFRFDLATYLLALLSTAANVGYYLIPAALADALHRRTGLRLRTAGILLLLTLGGCGAAYALRGAFLVNTYGTFKHALDFTGAHAGLPARLLLYAAALAAFLWLVYRVLARLRAARGGDPGNLLLPLLFAASWVVLAFGLARIYERHILPLYALGVLVLQQTQGEEADARLPALGWLGVALFGAAHGVLYAITVYEL